MLFVPQMPGYKFFEDATNNFCKEQKLGDNYLGEVYKANLPTGEVIAVRRLYEMYFDEERFSHYCTKHMSVSHKNLVRLLGYSCEKEKKKYDTTGEIYVF